MRTLEHDAVYVLRRLARAAAFALASVTLLGLAIAANACVFAVVYCLLWKPLPFPGADRLVNIVPHSIKENWDGLLLFETLNELAPRRDLFERFAGVTRGNLELENGPGIERSDLSTVFAELEFFGLLGLHPLAGRLPNELDVRAHDPGSLLVSAAFAAERFGSPTAALGQVLPLQYGRYRIIGVMPSDVPFASSAKLWVPVSLSPEGLKENRVPWVSRGLGIGRLAAGVRAVDAGERLTALLPVLQETPFSERSNLQIQAKSLRSLWLPPTGGLVLRLMLGTALLIMAITVINACNLYIARLASRGHESALLAALGASPGRVARFHLIEAALLALAATGLGLALAPAGLELLRHFDLMPEEAPYPIAIDGATLIFVALLTGVTAAALGASALWLQKRGGRIHETLKQSGNRQSASVRVRYTRVGLTVAQVALTVVLLFGSGLLVRSAHRLLSEDFGFDSGGLVVIGLNLEADADTYHRYVQRMRELVATLPGVGSTTLAGAFPFGNSQRLRSYQPPGMPAAEPSEWPIAFLYENIEPNFFSLFGQPLIAGRPFMPEEARAQAPVAIVDASFVKRHFPDGSGLGHSFRINLPPGDTDDKVAMREVTIVGVAAPVKSYEGLSGGDERPKVYMPGLEGNNLLIRTSIDPESLRRSLKSVAHELSPKARIGMHTMSDALTGFVRFRYGLNGLLELLSAVTLILAGTGLYAVLSFSVRTRMRELGVRLALGADAARLRREVLVQGLRLAAIGTLAGLPLAWAISRVLASQLYQVSPLDPVTAGAVLGIVTLASAAAAWWPAREAARVDPMGVLRAE
jgi:putative ABC transport system permease protein